MGIAAILIWQLILTLFFAYILKRYRKLVELEKINFEKSSQAKLSQRIEELERKESEHIQKVDLIRFNPFQETGGDNSFTLCLLNDKLDGVVLTALHTREKTRMYGKKIKNGKSEFELSKEEKKVIERALKQ
jgi:hypothetical protein